jgi:carboxymethylenebutenolidase
MSERISIETTDGAMPGQLWLPTKGSGPGIVLVQEIFGVSSYIERRAQDLADLGYVVVAPEFFWRLGVARVEEGPNAMEEGYGLLQRLDWGAAVVDGVAAVSWLRNRSEVSGGVGIVGFCLGGGLGFNVATEVEVDALVSYYGSGLPELLGLAPEEPGVPVLEPSQVAAPSLHHFGLVDSFIPRPMVEQIQATLTTQDSVTFITHEGGDHAFDNDDFHLYDEQSSTQAWGQTVDWLAEHLPA